MQTFLPVADFVKSARCLDYRRLSKQRVEASQLLATLGYEIHRPNGEFFKPTHQNHPCVKMWEGYEQALLHYRNVMIQEWIDRGFNNSLYLYEVDDVEMPPWFGVKRFHDSHKSNLLRKLPDWYSQFDWKVRDDLPYYWGAA
jgi:hypothetical protein